MFVGRICLTVDLHIDVMSISWQFSLMWTHGFNIIQVMALCLSQCWPRSLLSYAATKPRWVNTLRSGQNGRHFADDTFNRIFVNENVRISIRFSLKFVPKGPINNIPSLVQIMAWRCPGYKPLSEPVMVSLLTYICATRPQWVNRVFGAKAVRIQGFKDLFT